MLLLLLPTRSSITYKIFTLTLNLLTTIIVAPPSNASKWQMGFNSAFKGLIPLLYSWINVKIFICYTRSGR